MHPEDIVDLDLALNSGFDRQLLSEGLARNLIWTNGKLPAEAPRFRPNLSSRLVGYAFSLLSAAMRIRNERANEALVENAFRSAAQALESVVRDGVVDIKSGFLTIVAAASYHIGHYNARAFILANSELLNLSFPEKVFRELMLRRFASAKALVRQYVAEHSRRSFEAAERNDWEEVSANALALNYARATAALLSFFATGDQADIDVAKERFRVGTDISGKWGFAESWWLYKLSSILIQDFHAQSYRVMLPNPAGPVGDLRNRVIDHLANRKHSEVDLWPSQLEASIRAFDVKDDLVVALPTSAGKTRIAELAMIPTLANDRDVIYVTPLRSLSAQIERDIRKLFGELGFGVSSAYDVEVAALGDHSSRIRISTPEKLDFALRRDDGVLDNVGLIVFDEGHLIGTSAREIRYEQLIDRILRVKASKEIRFVCLSALLPAGAEFDVFTQWLRDGREGSAVRSNWRPTRQTFGSIVWRRDHARLDLEVENQTHFIERFVELRRPIGRARKYPFPNDNRELTLACAFRLSELGESVLIYCPLKASVKADAREMVRLIRGGYLSIPIPRSEHHLTTSEIAILGEWLGLDHPVTQCLMLGVAIHHGDLPRAVLSIVERLISERVAKIIIASPSIAQGINVSASTVIFRGLRRFNPALGYADLIPVEEFVNVIGRAGRAFVDIGGQILFPVGLESKTMSTRKDDWRKMRSRVAQRQLESGLVRLISGLLANMGTITDENVEFIASRINVDVSSKSLALQSEEDFDSEVDALDDAVLSLVQDSNIQPTEVAGLLDEVLRGSLFARTLKNYEDRKKSAILRIVEGRARGLVSRYTAAQRKSAYVSGVRLRLADRFSELVNSVGELIVTTEDVLRAGQDADLVDIARICASILEFPQFAFTGAREQVKDRVGCIVAWLSGEPLSEITKTEDNALIFLEEGVRYLSVWGLASVEEALNVDPKHAAIPLLLSCGVPSKKAARICALGLESRKIATRFAAVHPDVEMTRPELREWLLKNRKNLSESLSAEDRIVADSFFVNLRKSFARDARTLPPMEFALTSANAPPNGSIAFAFPVGENQYEATDRDLSVFGRGEIPLGHLLHENGQIMRVDGNHLVMEVDVSL